MKQNKIYKLKQKIICIPIIIITLISFVIPNYANASIGNDIFAAVQELLLYIPDAIICGLEKFFLGNNDSDKIIITNWDNFKNLVDDGISEGKDSKNIFIRGASTVAGGLKSWYDTWTNNTGFLGNITDWVWGEATNTAIDNLPALKNIYEALGDEDLIESVEKYGDEELKKAVESGDNVMNITLTNITFSPKLIFENQIPAFDVNFFRNKDDYKEKKKNIAYQLRNIVATWYVALRNIALVLMLLVLVITGIKIMISSVASDKAKYKQLLVDWVVAICLLVFLHYIMVFSVNMVELITDMFSDNGVQDRLMNLSRMKASNLVSVRDRFYWSLIYVVLIIYTLIFVWQYLKRVVKLAFLTLFAPIMAASYPIDKMSDGKAQGFNKWLKDYIYTLMIQPLHLLLYTILISSVQALTEANPIYTLVALGSFIPIEKMLRDYLGFERGHIKGPNPAGLLAATTLGKKTMDMLLPSNIKNKSGKNDKGNSSDSSSNNKPIDTKRGDSSYSLLAQGNENESNGSEEKIDPQAQAWMELGASEDEERKENNKNGRISKKGDNTPLDPQAQAWMEDVNKNGIMEGKRAENRFKNSNYSYRGLDENGKAWMNNIRNNEEIPKRTTRAKRKIKGAYSQYRKSNLAAGARSVRRKYGGKFVRKLTNGNKGIRGVASAAANIAKVGAGVVGAATLGTAGLAYGIASGDMSKTVELGAGGIVAGAAAGNRLMNAATGIAGKGADSITDIKDTFLSGYNPEGYEAKLQKKETERISREIKQNEDLIRMFKVKNKNMSEKQIMDGIDQYVEQGIDNADDIQKGFELEQKAGVNRTTAQGAMKLSKKVDASTLRDKSKTEGFRKSVENNLKGKVPNADKKSKESIRLLRMIHGVDSIGKVNFK